ncbi:hypothetical protein FHS16_003834 [Paenibacillus endophyticus]|uniref:RCK C-terminal domain-containing protein n=1 Tax=Paenibacillus endophyticus TaxID=1294268 RepID=A0A7W5GAX7_9BACL|nr:hypothetical protein [Paenibacillus endophyticus]MBB3153759.1 hypothetical protein [Paenibacillus endophyticus]
MDWLFIVVYGVLIGIVVEIAAALLIMTGLDHKIARFQAVSMLTATGFTTKESELVLRHPFRRRIAIFLIVFGVFSFAVIISSLSNILAQSFRVYQLGMVTAALAIVLLFLKNKRIAAYLTQKTEHQLEKVFELHELPVHEVLYIDEKRDIFTEVIIHGNSTFNGRQLVSIMQETNDLNILFILRENKKLRKCDIKIKAGDHLYVYGDKQEIENLFEAELENKQRRIEKEDEIVTL